MRNVYEMFPKEVHSWSLLIAAIAVIMIKKTQRDFFFKFPVDFCSTVKE